MDNEIRLLEADAGEERVISVRRIAEAVRSGKFRTREGFAPSDFYFAADTIDRSMRVGYQGQPLEFQWSGTGKLTSIAAQIGYREDCASFEDGKSFTRYGRKLLPEVRVGENYTSSNTADKYDTKTLRKYGETWSLPWETWTRDMADLQLLQRRPEDWGASAAYTREYIFTAKWAGDTSTFFTAGNGNYIGNYPLTSANLTRLRNLIVSRMTDPAGNLAPYAGPLYLVVPTTLYDTALELVKSDLVVDGTATAKAPNANVHKGRYTVIENPFLEALDSTQGTTAYYLFADPRFGRPAVRYGFLRGHEAPEMFIRAADVKLLTGGMDEFAGDFNSDTIAWKVRYTLGVDMWDVNGAVMSKGA